MLLFGDGLTIMAKTADIPGHFRMGECGVGSFRLALYGYFVLPSLDSTPSSLGLTTFVPSTPQPPNHRASHIALKKPLHLFKSFSSFYHNSTFIALEPIPKHCSTFSIPLFKRYKKRPLCNFVDTTNLLPQTMT